MNRKRIFVIWGFLVVLSLVLVGCGAPSSSGPATAATAATAGEPAVEAPAVETESQGTIHYLTYPWSALPDDMLARFTEETGIEIKQEVMGYEELNTKVTTSSAAQIAPADVFSTYIVPLAGHVAAGFIEPIDDCLSEETKLDVLGIDVFKFDDQLMGVPTYYDVAVLLYNKSHMDQAGVTKAPETMDELYDASMKIKEAGVSNYPLIMPLAAQPGTAGRWQLLSLVFGGEPLFDADLQPHFTASDSGGYKAMQFLVDTLGVIVDPAMVEVDNTVQGDPFFAGDASFLITNIGSLATADDPELSNVVGQISAALVPGSDVTRSAALNFYLDGLAISKDSANKEAACKFIEWWLVPANAQEIFTRIEVTPTREGALRQLIDEGLFPGGELVFEQSDYGMPVFAAGMPAWFDQWETDAASQINQAARGNLTIEQALQNIANKALELQQ